MPSLMRKLQYTVSCKMHFVVFSPSVSLMFYHMNILFLVLKMIKIQNCLVWSAYPELTNLRFCVPLFCISVLPLVALGTMFLCVWMAVTIEYTQNDNYEDNARKQLDNFTKRLQWLFQKSNTQHCWK